jgi:hypothetical protein
VLNEFWELYLYTTIHIGMQWFENEIDIFILPITGPNT